MKHNITYEHTTIIECSPDDYGWYCDCALWSIWIEDNTSFKMYVDFNITSLPPCSAYEAVLSFTNANNLLLFELIRPSYQAMSKYARACQAKYIVI